MLSVVATRYAKALVDVVLAPGSGLDSAVALTQLKSIAEMIAGSQDLRTALLSPAVSPPRKRAVISALLRPMNVEKRIQNFLYVVIDHRRVAEFPSIVEAFEVLADERLGWVRVDVSSAKPLDDAQRAQIDAQISQLAGKKAKLRFSQDPALLGGVVARVGSTVYDGSVRGQLDRLRTRLGR
jgi:F-type H+-transporting ATPase subunit delta